MIDEEPEQMPLDHYISQVHLRNFYSPRLDGRRMHAIRRSDLKRFEARSEDVCRIEDNSSNSYLQHDRVVEEFLKLVEPRYNASIAKLRHGNIDRDCIECVVGFAAYIISCSPAAMRISTAPLMNSLHATAEILDARDEFERAPPTLGGKTLTELLQDGTVHFKVDEKYPQALGISSIADYVSIFGNSLLDILTVDAHQGTPFFTSDFPVALEFKNANQPINRIVPLAPDLAVRIVPDIRQGRARHDFSFKGLRTRRILISRREAIAINQLIVQSAEDSVFFRDDLPWVLPFVTKNARFRIEPVSDAIPTENGSLLIETMRIRAIA